MTQSLFNRSRLRILVVLWVLLASLYTITYSGMIESGDARRLLDAVGSMVDYGDQYLDLTAWQFPPNQFDLNARLPLQGANIEPMQILSAAPLYWLARHIPQIGLVHTTYVFNVFVGATVGSILFLYALTLGYDERTAALATIVFGIGTAILPYSKSFFREPLMMLCLLLAALLIERLRRYRTVPLVIGAVVALLALALTKASGLLALPALLVIALPSLRGIDRRTMIVMLLIGLLLAGLVVALGTFDLIPGLRARYDIFRRLAAASGAFLPVALHSYLLSPGGSFWGTSPVVLLALPGAVMLLRRGQYRYPLAITLLVLAFAFGYGLLSGEHWFGGLSWPPRFLVPVLALLFVVALPALDWLAHHPRSRWVVSVAALLVYSVWVQISAVSLSWGEYPQYLPPESGGYIEWGGGHNLVQYFRWVIIPQLWSFRPLDNAWAVTNAPLIPLLLSGLTLACGVWLWRIIALAPDSLSIIDGSQNNPSSRRGDPWVAPTYRWSGSIMNAQLWRGGARRAGARLLRAVFYLPTLFALLYLLITWAGLRVLYERDDRYRSSDEALYAMLSIIETETTPDDLILLSTPGYETFFLNYRKNVGGGRVITLPLQPGERTSPEQPPLVWSDFPDALLTNQTIPLLHTLAMTHQRLWLLVEFGPDLGWSTRPVERFMSAHYYPIAYWQTAPQVRLIEYSTVNAPDVFGFRAAERPTDLVYDDIIHLAGFDLPTGTEYAPGAALPISLYWVTDAALEANYSVGLFLRAANGSPIAQSDWQPAGYFAPTSMWQVGVPVWDHRALRLPSDLSSGEYQLWVKVYGNPAGGAPQDLIVTGAETLDATIGVLPVRITVRNE